MPATFKALNVGATSTGCPLFNRGAHQIGGWLGVAETRPAAHSAPNQAIAAAQHKRELTSSPLSGIESIPLAFTGGLRLRSMAAMRAARTRAISTWLSEMMMARSYWNGSVSSLQIIFAMRSTFSDSPRSPNFTLPKPCRTALRLARVLAVPSVAWKSRAAVTTFSGISMLLTAFDRRPQGFWQSDRTEIPSCPWKSRQSVVSSGVPRVGPVHDFGDH